MINFRALEPRLKLDRAGKIEPISQPAHGHTSAVRVLNLATDTTQNLPDITIFTEILMVCNLKFK
jgi:hypothetical protein